MHSLGRGRRGGGGGGGGSFGRTSSSSSSTGTSSSLPLVAMDGFRPVKRDFDTIRKECLKNKVLWEDPDFPAAETSLYYSRHPPYTFDWKRPHEIANQFGKKPELFVDGASRFDIIQGELGDCWVVAAAASMSENMELLFRVLPRGQSFKPEWYTGMFCFSFWRYGKWEKVIIDDRLPTLRGELLFVHSKSNNEFWGSLLEKAYAKLHGSYEALKAGFVADALHDLTGGLTESYNLRGDAPLPRNVVNILFKALERQSLIGCGINPIKGRQEAILHNGLVAGHAYSITDLREIRLISDQREVPITLIRIRNPWGTKIEWNGPWSDRSQEWNSIPESDRKNMGLVFRDDGEFWMDFRDFLTNFDTLDLCNLTPDAPLDTPRKWHVFTFHGRWRKGVDAGGRPVCRDTHWCNPQFKVSLKDTDEDEDMLCSFVVELMQKDRRKLRQKGPIFVDIGFVIYKCFKEFQVPLPKQYFDKYTFVERCDFYCNARQITKRFLMPPGDYVIIPSTFDANTEADFMLRIYFEKDNRIEYVEDHAELVEPTPAPVDPLLKEKEEQFKRFFYDTAGENMEIDVYQFWKLLNTGLAKDPNHRDVSIDSCKTMLCLVDVDNTGKLGYHEFLYLWNCVHSWKRTFQSQDTKTMGSIDAYEFRAALSSLGYRLSPGVINKLVFRFSDDKLQVELDSFLNCMARMLRIFYVFKSHRKNGTAAFSLDEYLQEALVI